MRLWSDGLKRLRAKYALILLVHQFFIKSVSFKQLLEIQPKRFQPKCWEVFIHITSEESVRYYSALKHAGCPLSLRLAFGMPRPFTFAFWGPRWLRTRFRKGCGEIPVGASGDLQAFI